jgi:hypothetical protein
MIKKEQPLADEFRQPKLPRSYTKAQLDFFGKTLQEFYEDKQLPIMSDRSKKETVRVINIWRALEAFGAARKNKPVTYNDVMSESYSIVVKDTGGDRNGNKSYEMPTRYDIFMDKYDQWLKLKGGREYADEMRLKDFSDMEESVVGDMRYTPNVPEYE